MWCVFYGKSCWLTLGFRFQLLLPQWVFALLCKELPCPRYTFHSQGLAGQDWWMGALPKTQLLNGIFQEHPVAGHDFDLAKRCPWCPAHFCPVGNSAKRRSEIVKNLLKTNECLKPLFGYKLLRILVMSKMKAMMHNLSLVLLLNNKYPSTHASFEKWETSKYQLNAFLFGLNAN